MNIIDELKPIKEFLSAGNQEFRMEPQPTDDSHLLSLQQEELAARNEEIYRLRTICGGNPIPS